MKNISIDYGEVGKGFRVLYEEFLHGRPLMTAVGTVSGKHWMKREIEL